MRAPWVCGVAGGVGTTTIAASLQARDLGVYRGGPAEIVVCRSTGMSIGAAHRVVNAVPGKPVLVVVADGPLRTPAAVRARVRMVEPHVTALVWMPYVERWREIDQVLEQAAAVPYHPENVPRWLRAWAAALLRVADAVLPLVDHAPSAPPATGDLNAPPEPRAAVGAQSPGIVVMQGSRPSPPPTAVN